ncbi:MAG TPA: Rhomboid family protein [Candidatus Faecalibacterium avium]|uniref:rhomboid family intramembrane serine protease n=1 Tax=unclassified Faecalibacterium TaxID=2646395 RepID=UPI000B36AB37|nr:MULTISPECIES: rhomboid family intramembrane serine protease [unclassified Faecalibacterium]OUN72397.1 Rhomboid family protein [Faecalibacterium sp. An58]OUQ36543.1 Rhomboid family protein [Faecalibacterium sp. An121]HIV44563.1 Rhomboid family protein [Candidatus Faecalibacterium avium]
MNWLTKLERKYGRWCIPNLIAILVGGQIVVYAVELFVNRYITYFLTLTRPALFAGEVWRLVTFLFVPFSSGGILSFALGAYFTWFIGSALEAVWGDFRFNLYILAGMLGAVLACLATGWADTYCLSLSLLLAFALLYPEMQVLLFYIIPIKVKYFGIFAAAIWVLSFFGTSWAGRLNYLLSMAGFFLFFGPVLWSNIRAWYRREQWRRRNRR